MFFKNQIFSFLILYLSFFLFSLQLWLDRYFGVVDIEQFLFFFLLGFEGLLDTDDYIINKFIEICILLPIILIIFTYFLYYPILRNFSRTDDSGLKSRLFNVNTLN